MNYPPAVQRPGQAWKQGYPGLAVNARRGVICHSMVGRLADALARLDGPDTASWHFSVAQDGTVYQHYDAMAVCWHAGSRVWNGLLIGVEHEGGAPGNESEPLTAAQLAASVALVRWLAANHGFSLSRARPQKTLWEHNEVYATSCPSGRIPWAEYEEDPMTPDEKAQFDALVTAHMDLQQQVTALAQGTDSVLKGALRYLWALAGKRWPWP